MTSRRPWRSAVTRALRDCPVCGECPVSVPGGECPSCSCRADALAPAVGIEVQCAENLEVRRAHVAPLVR